MMTEERKQELLNEMCEYVAEYVGDDEEEMPVDVYDGAWYIKELVGMSDVCSVLQDCLGMTDEELVEVGFEIEIEEDEEDN